MIQLKRDNQSSPLAFALIFGVIWSGGALCPLIVGLTSDQPAALIIGIVFLAIGLLITGLIAIQALAKMKVAEPELWISSPLVGVGDIFKVTYRQGFKSNISPTKFNYTLIFRETAIYSSGTDTVTVHKDVNVAIADFPLQSFHSDQVFNDERTLQIPPGGMHTFSARRNKLRWFIRVQIGIPGWPDFQADYELMVSPGAVGAIEL